MNIAQYLQIHHAMSVAAGKSGAEVFYLDNGTTAKYARRDAISRDIWDSCIREARFYESISHLDLSFLPKIMYLEITDEELLIVMHQYTPLTVDRLTPQMLSQILGALASLHRETPPEFLLSEYQPIPPHIDSATAAACAEGWASVLAEHGQEFSADAAFPILAAGQFNRINERHTLKKTVLCHGDFHMGNILLDDADNPIFCDFQSCGIGDGCGDLSFFISRLSADGVQISSDSIIESYSTHSGLSVDEIKKRMALSNFNTSFLFWHQYLHGSDTVRVHTIFDAMKSDFVQLSAE